MTTLLDRVAHWMERARSRPGPGRGSRFDSDRGPAPPLPEWYVAALSDGLATRARWFAWASTVDQSIRRVRVSRAVWAQLLLARWADREEAGKKVEWRYFEVLQQGDAQTKYLQVLGVEIRPRDQRRRKAL